MKRYGLLGRTLKHSFSKRYFTEKFAAESIPAAYENFELPIVSDFPQLLENHPDLLGLNVTIPYKEEILPYLTDENEVVRATGACNCIRIDGDSLIGFNTDVVGFRKTLEPHLKAHHQSALVLGTGGASKAVCYVLQELGISYRLVSRKGGEGLLSYQQLTQDVISNHTVVINTTPLGTFPEVEECPPIPYRLFTQQHFLFDLIYNPEKTKFLAEGEKQGAQICNGYQMLIEQAEESWRIWNQA